MGSFDTFANLRTDILDRAGEATDGTSDYHSAAGRQLVRAAYEVYNAHPFLFLRKYPPGALRTVAPITTGTVAVTAGSASITFSSAPGVSVANRKVRVTGWSEVYRISAHTAGQVGATLDVAWSGDTNATASYTVFQDEYDVATDVRHIVWMAPAGEANALGIPQRAEEFLREKFPDPPEADWPPSAWARIGEQKVRFAGYPDRARRIEYAYTIQGDDIDTGTIHIPANWRYVLADVALFWLYTIMDDDRARSAALVGAGGVEKMIEDDSRKRGVLTGGTPSAGPYR